MLPRIVCCQMVLHLFSALSCIDASVCGALLPQGQAVARTHTWMGHLAFGARLTGSTKPDRRFALPRQQIISRFLIPTLNLNKCHRQATGIKRDTERQSHAGTPVLRHHRPPKWLAHRMVGTTPLGPARFV